MYTILKKKKIKDCKSLHSDQKKKGGGEEKKNLTLETGKT